MHKESFAFSNPSLRSVGVQDTTHQTTAFSVSFLEWWSRKKGNEFIFESFKEGKEKCFERFYPHRKYRAIKKPLIQPRNVRIFLRFLFFFDLNQYRKAIVRQKFMEARDKAKRSVRWLRVNSLH